MKSTGDILSKLFPRVLNTQVFANHQTGVSKGSGKIILGLDVWTTDHSEWAGRLQNSEVVEINIFPGVQPIRLQPWVDHSTFLGGRKTSSAQNSQNTPTNFTSAAVMNILHNLQSTMTDIVGRVQGLESTQALLGSRFEKLIQTQATMQQNFNAQQKTVQSNHEKLCATLSRIEKCQSVHETKLQELNSSLSRQTRERDYSRGTPTRETVSQTLQSPTNIQTVQEQGSFRNPHSPEEQQDLENFRAYLERNPPRFQINGKPI